MKFLKLILFIKLLILISSCGTVKDAFTNQKKNSSDEFLVEKKSPLVMPPDYNELPAPITREDKTNSGAKKIQDLISKNNDNNLKNSNSNEEKNLEKYLLEKIKSN